MKAIYKSLIAAAFAAPMLTGCIEEAIPTNTVIASQLVGNSNAIEAFASAMPAHLNVMATVGQEYHFDFGWPSLMHIRDVMTEDMCVRYAGGFDWFSSWSRNDVSLGPRYLVCQYPWNYFYAQILTTNNTIKAIDPETEEPSERYNLGAAKTFRAMTYLDAGRMYEVLPTSVTTGVSDEGNNIIGLTLPIITDQTTEDEMRNNPRAKHEVLFEFIVSDLESAITLMQDYTRPKKTMPDVACAKGLLARAYLWDASFQAEVRLDNAAAAASYGKAAQYAREAITESGATPLTRNEWLDPQNGFNDINVSSWLWGGQYNVEDDAVQAGGIRTWTSFCSNEQNFGYAGSECGSYSEIGAAVYERISDNDWRKLSWIAPEDSPLSGKEVYLSKEYAEANFDGPYISLKIRPGSGEMDDPKVGAVVGYPLMRVEELYFIEAEAVAHTNAGSGKALLESFMHTYRYPEYNSQVSSDAALIDEIVFQKRIELWGEGRSFYDFKRLNMNVTRWYPGTNFEEAANTFNTIGRPAWMNFCIVNQEVDNNPAIKGYNTPSPSGLYKAATSAD